MKLLISLWIIHIHLQHLTNCVVTLDHDPSAGSSPFRDVLRKSTFIDKSLMIKDFFETCTHDRYVLFTSPRGLGKSTNLDMLYEFVRIQIDESGKPINPLDSFNYQFFTNASFSLQIATHKEVIDSHLAAYPTIFLDLIAVSGATIDEVLASLKQALQKCFKLHSSLYKHLHSKSISHDDITLIAKILDGTAHDDEWLNSFTVLSRVLFQYFGKKIFVMVNAYDTPLLEGIDKPGLDLNEVFDYLTDLLKSFNMDSKHVDYAFFTGITCVAKTDPNNLQHQRYLKDVFLKSHFGLTDTELADLFFRHTIAIGEQRHIKQSYKGYTHQQKSTRFYHTYSIIHYLQNEGAAKHDLVSYWGHDAIMRNLHNVLKSEQFREYIVHLIFNTHGIIQYRPRVMLFDEIKEIKTLSDDNMYEEATGIDVFRLFTYLFDAGYVSSIPLNRETTIHVIPNEEIRDIFAINLEKHYLKKEIDLPSINKKLIHILFRVKTNEELSEVIQIFNTQFPTLHRESDPLICSHRDYAFEFKAIIYSALQHPSSNETAAHYVHLGNVEPRQTHAKADIVLKSIDHTFAMIIKVTYKLSASEAVDEAKTYKLPENFAPQHITYMGVNVAEDYSCQVDISLRDQITPHARTTQEATTAEELLNRQEHMHSTTSPEIPKLKEIQGDLFDANHEYSLVHCVAEDLQMGAGIAVHFKRIFGGLKDLHNQDKKVGQVAVLKRDGRSIFYLITKKYSYGLPTMASFTTTIVALKDICIREQIMKLAMPRIGCGLDQLHWPNVKDLLQKILCSAGIRVVVYYL